MPQPSRTCVAQLATLSAPPEHHHTCARGLSLRRLRPHVPLPQLRAGGNVSIGVVGGSVSAGSSYNVRADKEEVGSGLGPRLGWERP